MRHVRLVVPKRTERDPTPKSTHKGSKATVSVQLGSPHHPLGTLQLTAPARPVGATQTSRGYRVSPRLLMGPKNGSLGLSKHTRWAANLLLNAPPGLCGPGVVGERPRQS